MYNPAQYILRIPPYTSYTYAKQQLIKALYIIFRVLLHTTALLDMTRNGNKFLLYRPYLSISTYVIVGYVCKRSYLVSFGLCLQINRLHL